MLENKLSTLQSLVISTKAASEDSWQVADLAVFSDINPLTPTVAIWVQL